VSPQARTELKQRASESIRQLPSKDIETRIGVPPNDFDKLITLSPVDPHWRELELIHNGDHRLISGSGCGLVGDSFYPRTGN